MFHGGGGGWWTYVSPRNEHSKRGIDRALLMRVLGYARPYRWHIVWMLGFILASTFLGLLTPLIFREMIDNALQPPGNAQLLNFLALGLVTIPIISGFISVLQRRINATVGEGVIYDLRVALFGHLQRMSLRFFTNTKTGELMSRLNGDVIGAQNAVSNVVVTIITNILSVIAILGVMLTLEWRLTILGVLVLPFFIIIARRTGSKLRDIFREQMENDARMNAMMNETLNISGALLVKLFGRTTNETQRFASRAENVRDVGIIQAVIGTQFFVLVGFVSVIGTAVVYWIGGHLVLQGEFTVGTIVAFGTYLTQLYGPLQALTNAPVSFATSMVSFERVFEILDLSHEIDEKPNALVLEDVKGDISFEDVTFVYDASDKNLLRQVDRVGRMDNVKNVLSGDGKTDTSKPSTPAVRNQARENALSKLSFNIDAGQLVALVGPSGAGKTSLTYLIPRIYDPSSGIIRLDGHDLRDISLDTLSKHIGMVTQETYLFHDTIRTNLQYAKLDATQEELEVACKVANIHDFIMGLSEGYDTVVGERGYRLSGGEKQRIAIARVVLKNPRILVLDEATSSLDSQSEALIQDALANIQKGRTSIIIAHRLSTILSADSIFVVDAGEIVERGTHSELLAKEGLYATLYETQFRAQQKAFEQS